MPKIMTIGSLDEVNSSGTGCGCADASPTRSNSDSDGSAGSVREPSMGAKGLGNLAATAEPVSHIRWAWKCPKGMKQIGMKTDELKRHCRRVKVEARPRRKRVVPDTTE